mgnify:CR=1 FL=1|tara:strand:- start:251 stop:589 length:339 start_codon:yes stop_codon:yes gene_type:complete
MRTKISSLSKNKDFKSLLSGKKITNKYLTIFFKKLSDKDNEKLNLSIVTKKKIGNAVQRNFIKRRIKNIMNEATKKTKLNLDYSYLLLTKKSILDDEYENIKKKLIIDFGKI